MRSPAPSNEAHVGRVVTLERLRVDHAQDLWEAVKDQEALWHFTFDGPYEDYESFLRAVEAMAQAAHEYYYAIVVRGRAVGRIALTDHNQTNRVCQVGHILLSPSLQRTTEATEAFYLLIKAAFEELHLRRLEWKCDNTNLPSKRAARRLGFSYEGLFRKHMIRRGKNRDTAWFSLLDDEWFGPAGLSLQQWLQADNFDQGGGQKLSLEAVQSGLGFLPAQAPPARP